MIAALIVAAGQGVRMGAAVRKQYLDLAGLPILIRTLSAFVACDRVDRIVVAVPEDEIAHCRRQISGAPQMHRDVQLVAGGRRRQDSVNRGLEAFGDAEGVVLIHDGVRPLVSRPLIEGCIDGALKWGACIPVVAVSDTLKRLGHGATVSETVSRRDLFTAQTPQAFHLSLIREAHRLAAKNGWEATDDASLVEQMGVAVHTIAGAATNIKITTPMDLRRAEAYHRYAADIQGQSPPVRNGR